MGCQEVEDTKTPGVEKLSVQDEKKKAKRRRRGSAARRGAKPSGLTAEKLPVIEQNSQITDQIVQDQKEKLDFVTKTEVSPFGVQAFIIRHHRALRSVPTKLPPVLSATKRVKRVSWKDEESGGGCASADPAVLAMGPARKPLQYSREQLLALKNSPHAKLQPEITHEAFNTIRKRTESPNDEDRGARGDAPNDNHKGGGFARNDRRPADPRERVRKESEPSGGGIVLSPQRRSFTSGCGAPGVPAPPPTLARTRPESPLSTPGTGSNKNDSVRRIGSGRILTRDVTTVPWERSTGVPSEDLANEKQAAAEAEAKANQTSQPYRPPNALPRDRGDDRFERRSFGRDSFGTDLKRDRDRDERFGDKRDRDDNRRMNRFGGQRGRYDKDSEPEWFSGGPTSQLETIELRGFDEPSSKSRTTNGNAKDSEKWGSGGRSPVSTNGRWRKEPAAPAQPAAPASPPPARSTPTPNATTEDEPQLANNDKDSGVELKSGEDAAAAQEQMVDFNLDDFLKSDSIPDFTNGSVEPEGGSRFSRWFRRESPVGDHERLFNNIMDDLEGNNSESQHMFAPISPAGPPGSVPQQHQHQPAPPPPSLLELLQRANAASGTPHPPHNDMNAGGKMQSLEELEAQLRGARAPQLAAPASHPHTPTHQHDNDLTAFKRLLAQASGGHAVPGNHEPLHMKQQQQQQQHLQQQQQQPPMSLLQMLNKSVEQQHKQQQAQQQAQQQQPPHIPQELLYKLLQVQQSQQQQQQQQQHQQQQEMGPGSLPEHELLARPEASAIIRGLKHGEITSQHLIQQLGNPGLQSRHREMLLSILRQHNMQQQHQHHQMGGSPLPGSMGAPHLVVPPHHQPLRLSPLPPQSAPPAHMPSPHELSYRAQTIMQNALIKKKLEEARENYRRRHDPQAKQSISFTPTSVLRQMTADKETESHIGGKPGQPWPQMPQKVPQGRPIVKGNHGASGMNNVSPQMGMFPPTPTGFHSPPHYHNHPQMSGGMHQFPHQQQRQPQPPQMSRGGGGNTTLHQLLVQSHHRSINGQSQLDGGIGMGGDATSNQLARWFSPELLAQASAGKLPSVHVPNALSLEDLERNHHSATVRN